MTQRLTFLLVALLTCAVGVVLFVRSSTSAVATTEWREGFPERLLYEFAPSTQFPTARTTALGRRVDVDYGNGMSIGLEIADTPDAARALARAWFDADRASAKTAVEGDDGFDLSWTQPAPKHARIVSLERAAIRTAGSSPGDPARLLTWIPGIQRGIIEDPIAVLRRDHPAGFWISLALAGCVTVLAAGRAIRAKAS